MHQITQALKVMRLITSLTLGALLFAMTINLQTYAIETAKPKNVAQTITVFDNLNSVKLTICQPHNQPTDYHSTLSVASRYLKPIATSGQPKGKIKGVKIQLPGKGCFDFAVNLERYFNDHPEYLFDKHRMLETGLLIWYPATALSIETWQEFRDQNLLRFNSPLPHGLPLSTLGDDLYRYPPYPPFMSLPFPIGSFQQSTIRRGDLVANVNFLALFTTDERIKLLQWLTQSLNSSLAPAIDDLNGTVQINLSKAKHTSYEVLPYAMVYRGEGTNITFEIHPDATQQQLLADWTAYHEFSHLLLPFVSRNDAWMSEGLASLLQYFAMLRNDVLDDQEAVKRLYAGFNRGRSNQLQHANTTLQSLSSELSSNRAYRAVYWWGAHIWFDIDIRLRQQQSSLPQLISKFNRCCRYRHSIWRAADLAQTLDTLIEQPFIWQLIKRRQRETQFPFSSAVFTKIGITQINSSKIKIANKQAFENFLRIYQATD